MRSLITFWGILLMITVSNVSSYGQWLEMKRILDEKKKLTTLFGREMTSRMTPKRDSSILMSNKILFKESKRTFNESLDLLFLDKPDFKSKILTDSSSKTEDYEEVTVEEVEYNLKISRAIAKLSQNSLNNYHLDSLPLQQKVRLKALLKSFILEKKKYFEESALILSQMNLNKEEVDVILNTDQLPTYVRARLGDLQALESFIIRFKEAAYDSIRNNNTVDLALKLLCIDSRESINVFFDALCSDHVQKYKWVDDQNILQGKIEPVELYALAQLMLEAYDKYYPLEINYFLNAIFFNGNFDEYNRAILYYGAVSNYLSVKHNKDLRIRAFFLKDGVPEPRVLGEH